MTRYKVTGPVAFMEIPPGEEFEAELDPELEARALERGSIRKVKAKSNHKEDESDAEADRA